MRIASYIVGGRSTFGIVEDDTVSDLAAAGGDLVAWLSAGRPLPSQATPRHKLADVAFLPVVPNPGKILCVGLNYQKHVKETGRADSAYPAMFTRFADSQVGHLQPLVRPTETERFDYEGELAVVIGKPGRRIKRADALQHVAGYSCYNEGSVRDWQRHTHQFTPGKTFPKTGGFGPWLATPEIIPDPQNLHIRTLLNGEVMQDARTSEMIFPVDEIIAYVSTFTPLAVGDVIITGTPGGVGDRREPPLYMKPGDVAVVEISGVGRLENSIIQEDA